MQVRDLARAMDAIAPTALAEPWDNVGLLVGDGEAAVTRVMLAIDCTREVVAEASGEKCEAIVSYHPVLFEGRKRFVAGSSAFDAARAGIAVYCPHTALDVAEGGTNDVLADAVGMSRRAPLRAAEPRDAEYKLVTFVPAEHVEAVSRALFAAGAGRIGDYSSCSFRVAGTGTFFGESGTSPVVGQAGRLEEAAELRLETVVPVGRAAEAVRALRDAHPYEEPAFDLVKLASVSARGIGRVGPVEPQTVRAVVDRVKRALGVERVLAAGPLEREVSRVAVCAGAGGALLGAAIEARADLFLTGELRHHDVLRAIEAGLTVLCVLHSASERAALGPLAEMLKKRLPGVAFLRSTADREPIVFA
jgi:dinuclear metal center YbgI/SA1388 family protein